MNPVLIRFHDKGRRGVIQAGKFVEHMGKRLYVYNIEDSLRILDGFGVAPCVLDACEEHGIQEIHYVEKRMNLTYITTPAKVREHGVPFQGKKRHVHSRGTYLHLPRQWWGVDMNVRRYPWASETLWLKWTEPEPTAKPVPADQMELL